MGDIEWKLSENYKFSHQWCMPFINEPNMFYVLCMSIDFKPTPSCLWYGVLVNRILPVLPSMIIVFPSECTKLLWTLGVEIKTEKILIERCHIICHTRFQHINVIRITSSQQPTRTMDIIYSLVTISGIVIVTVQHIGEERETECVRVRENFPRENFCVTSQSNRITLTAIRSVCTRKTHPERYNSASPDGCASQ